MTALLSIIIIVGASLIIAYVLYRIKEELIKTYKALKKRIKQ
jgi:hypothetical protein